MTSESAAARVLEAQVLRWIVCLPLVLAVDLELLTRTADDAVRRAVDTLDRHGWIERITLRFANYPDPLVGHVLRTAAIPAFARAFDVDEARLRRSWPVQRRDVLDRIASFEITYSVNRFLASVASDFLENGNYGVVNLRSLPRRRAADRAWPALMDAYGSVAAEQDFRPFLVAWDRALVPAKHRAARVAAWYDARGDGNWPTILIVCPGDAEREEWEHAIRVSADRRDTHWLDVAFTTNREAFGQRPTGARWRLPGEDERLSLTTVVEPVDGLMRPLPQPFRLDLIDRGVGGRTQTWQRWAEGMLASGRGRSRERLAALRLMMDPAHRTVLSALSHHPYLTSRDLPAVLREKDERVSGLLANLERYELVGSLTEAPPCP